MANIFFDMRSITFDRFELGIDLRKGSSVSDANRLREMRNANVTTGRAIEKRRGLMRVTTLESGTKGLFSAFGKLQTFYSTGTITHADPRFKANKVPHPDAQKDIKDIHFSDVYSGYIYAAVEYADGTCKHHYLDTRPNSVITDVNCPHSTQVIKLASKIYAAKGDVVRYSKTADPTNWTAANDAGFLPFGMNASGDKEVTGLGEYRSQLAIISRDSVQIWNADPDPAQMAIVGKVKNVGTSWHNSVQDVAGDMYFLSDYGFRSVTTQQLTDNLADIDVGAPIDQIVRQETRHADIAPKSVFYYGTGQYICAIGNRVFVYFLSTTSKIAAWSEYRLPFNIDAFAELGQDLYIRSGDDIYLFSEDSSMDGSELFEVYIELPYMDFKAAGSDKTIYEIDVVLEGECEISIGYDVSDPDAYTPPIRVRGNTRRGGKIPIGITGTEFSLRVRNFDDKPFRLDAITLYYHQR